MKVSQVVNFKFLFSPRTLALLLSVGMFAVSISAQKTEIPMAPEAVGVNIEQCANGPVAAPINCNVATANDGYTRGNLIASKSHYFEGDFVPIRIVAEGLTVNTEYTVTIGYDYTKGGKYANDYLGTYTATESVSNNPCVNYEPCGTASTAPIPTDPQVALGFDGLPATGDEIVQAGGVFTCFGCSALTPASTYGFTGSTSGDSTKSLVITFTAGSSTVIIAYSSHISTRTDWGLANSAINITGSPYHNYVVDFPGANSGNRDLQLSADAVIFPASVTITKLVTNFNLTYASTTQFGFTSSLNFGTSSFSLTDLDPLQNAGDSRSNTSITAFGAANTITVTEDLNALYTLGTLTCTESPGGLPNIPNSTTSIATRTATIIVEEGEIVQCTFYNTQIQPSAAGASVSGRVVTADGAGIRGAVLSVTNVNTGETFSTISSTFGYYTFEDLPVSDFYVVSIASKRFSFPNSTMSFTLNDSISDLDFIANP